MEVRGWHAIISDCIISENNCPSCGTCILVKKGKNIGVQPAPLPQYISSSRAAAAILELPGHKPIVFLSCYFEVTEGLAETNLRLLAAAGWFQQKYRMPVFMGADFNMAPSVVTKSGVLERAGLELVYPAGYTFFTSKSRSKLDYFMMSSCIKSSVQAIDVLKQYPLSPHRPVKVTLGIGSELMIPVLSKPQKLPTRRPVGPSPENHPWTKTTAALDALEQILDLGVEEEQRRAALNKTYDFMVSEMEITVSRATDTPLRQPGKRSGPPKLIWLSAKAVESQHRAEWKSFWRPTRWLLNQILEAQRILSRKEVRALPDLLQALSEPPTEFQESDELRGMLSSFTRLVSALQQDMQQGDEPEESYEKGERNVPRTT